MDPLPLTLTPFFDWVLAASARASLLTVVVLIAQAVLRHRVPARWCYALWLPVLIVLLMPAFPESSWSVSSITRMAPAPLPLPPVIHQVAPVPVLPQLAVASEMALPIPWRQVMLLTWLAGAAGMVLFGILAFVQTLWRFRRSRLPVSDALQRELAALAREVGLRQSPRVWLASAIRSPAVAGLLRPAVLLPAHFEQTLAPHEARLVLKHELTHIKRGDLPVNALLCLLLALHWFNPLIWLAFFKARLDRETACDAQVLDREDQAQRVAYGHTLLKVETAFNYRGLSLGFVGIFQRGSALRARIRSIASQPKQHPLMKTALSLSIVLLTFLGITKAATPNPNTPHIYINTKFIETSELVTEPPSGPSLPAPLDTSKKVPGLVGTLTDPQFQVLIRTLSQRKGVDLLSAPSVTTKSGQQAKVEVIREFEFPDETGKVQSVTENTGVGVSLAIFPRVTAKNQISLEVSPEVVEFEGFAKPKSGTEEAVVSRTVLHPDGTTTESVSDAEKGERRESKFDARGVLLSKKTVPYAAPLFSKRNAKANAVLNSGESMIMEMEPRLDKQIVEDRDEKDHLISERTDVYRRRVWVFVTARLVDPVNHRLIDPATGKPFDTKPAKAATKEAP